MVIWSWFLRNVELCHGMRRFWKKVWQNHVLAHVKIEPFSAYMMFQKNGRLWWVVVTKLLNPQRLIEYQWRDNITHEMKKMITQCLFPFFWNYANGEATVSFLINGPKQNARSLLTPGSYTDVYYMFFYVVGYILFSMAAPETTEFRLWLAVKEFWPMKKRLKKLPCERAWKTVSETKFKSDLAFCLGPSVEKTNSEMDSLLIRLLRSGERVEI